jgi:ubiquinone/menaquinone biosynthesis C-methylase UbiE
MSLQETDVKAEIKEKWNESSESYDSHHGHGIKTEEEREAWIKALTKVLPQGRSKLLDVGCGTGEMSLLLAELGYDVIGVDLSDKMLQKARSKAKKSKLKIRFVQGDAERLDFGDDSFEVVINRHLLWTLSKPEAALQEWKRILVNGGKVIVIDGLWNDGSLNHRLRRLLADASVLFMERRNPRRGGYSKEMKSVLPHLHGMSEERARDYFGAADLQELDVAILEEIRDIQRKYMPLSQRITYDFVYYMISGCKRRN